MATSTTMSRTCSQCGFTGHNSRTCPDSSNAVAAGAGTGTDSQVENGIMLFGVRVTTGGGGGGGGGGLRKSASMINLSSQFDQQNHHHHQDANNVDSDAVAAAGYASDDVVHASVRNRDRKRGVPWTEEEHRMFLFGLEKVGKGDWRGISRNFVKSRTPTQVASHAQKYFIRRNNHNRRRRRSSLFDMTTDSVMDIDTPTVEDPIFSLHQNEGLMKDLTLGQSSKMNICLSPRPTRTIPLIPIPSPSKMAKLSLHETPVGTEDCLHLSLKLPATTTTEEKASLSLRRSPVFEGVSDNFNNNGDGIITVA